MCNLDFSALVHGSKVEDHQQTTNIYQVDNSKNIHANAKLYKNPISHFIISPMQKQEKARVYREQSSLLKIRHESYID
jgi:hypothetical protein